MNSHIFAIFLPSKPKKKQKDVLPDWFFFFFKLFSKAFLQERNVVEWHPLCYFLYSKDIFFLHVILE